MLRLSARTHSLGTVGRVAPASDRDHGPAVVHHAGKFTREQVRLGSALPGDGWIASRPISGVLSTLLAKGWVAIHLSDLPWECLVSNTCGPRAPTFDLAPGGVYLAILVAQDAGALLPHRFTLTCAWLPRPSAVCSLWHCPARHRDSRFASTLPFGAPTFLTSCRQVVRPPSRLTIRINSDTPTLLRQE